LVVSTPEYKYRCLEPEVGWHYSDTVPLKPGPARYYSGSKPLAEHASGSFALVAVIPVACFLLPATGLPNECVIGNGIAGRNCNRQRDCRTKVVPATGCRTKVFPATGLPGKTDTGNGIAGQNCFRQRDCLQQKLFPLEKQFEFPANPLHITTV